MPYLLGYDVGSSSIKAALLDATTGICVASAFSPQTEMPIAAPRPGWAEQEPELWWRELIAATRKLQQQFSFRGIEIIAIGISYQMHGLVCIDKEQNVLRPAIIWCDSRAVEIGNAAFEKVGRDFCLKHLLNSPGNFTASKLRWVKENEPRIFEKTSRVLLPGDYIAMRLSGEAVTTIPGLSEGIFWDFVSQKVSQELLDHYELPEELLAPRVPTFGEQGRLGKETADALGMRAGIPIAYRAGDQPNNAYSLKVLHPGEVAATAGTSGVIYAVHDRPQFDPQSRVNTFVHVNHTAAEPRNGILLCVNGAGILNGWLRKIFAGLSYDEMNRRAAGVRPGADGLLFFPFGNGSERILPGKKTGAQLCNLDFNAHGQAHVLRAAQEGIVFALRYGFDIMQAMGARPRVIKAACANMFLSPVFCEAFANTTGAVVQLYNTDGAQGAARAAGVGAGFYKNFDESFAGMQLVDEVVPQIFLREQYDTAYHNWLEALQKTVGI